MSKPAPRLQTIARVKNRGYRSNKYLDAVRPHVHEKQRWFLAMEQREVLFGGAAGGGKSDALLMAALQYADVPGYAAILFRRTFAELNKSGALMARANEWLSQTDALRKDSGRKWEFPGGGTLEFGYLETDADRLQYQSAEYQFVGFDEVSHIPEGCYTYLATRVRRTQRLGNIPLRVRAASNPGGPYGEWVKHNFIPKAYLRESDFDVQFSQVWGKSGECILCRGLKQIERRGQIETCPGCEGSGKTVRYFVPARVEDNPSTDLDSYEMNLAVQSPEIRQQLRYGRWDFVSDGKIYKRDWIKHYTWRGEHLILHTSHGQKIIDSTKWWTFITADTASKIKTTNDPTVICVWAYCEPNGQLCLLDVHRDWMLTPFILPKIIEYYRHWDCRFAIIEEASSGIAIIQEASVTERGQGISIKAYSPHTGDKIERSHYAQNRMEGGQIFFPCDHITDTGIIVPVDNDTISYCVNEMLQFFDDELHDDFCDNLSMAGWYAANYNHRIPPGRQPGEILKQGLAFKSKLQRY